MGQNGRLTLEIEIRIDGKAALASDVSARAFSTGSVGYQLPGKIIVKGIQMQANVQFTAVKSKELADPARADLIARLNAPTAK